MAAADYLTPCGWAPDPPACCPQWADAAPAEQTRSLNAAVRILYNLTGRQFSRCPQTIRPCRKRCTELRGGWEGGQWVPVLDNGVWTNVRCGCGHEHACSCGDVAEVMLPGMLPEPTSVVIDGEPVDLSAFRVDSGRWLVRQDGGVFPDCQDLSRPAGEPGTWTVTFEAGTPIPPEANWYAATLACELVKACGDGPNSQCRLPSNIQELHRNGVDIVFASRDRATAKGTLTGLPEVDTWIQSINPAALPWQPRVWSPDLPDDRTVTWP